MGLKEQAEIALPEKKYLLTLLKERFAMNMHRHKSMMWEDLMHKLEANEKKIAIIHAMEETAGEPDVVDYDKETNEFVFYDCSAESPKGRRSLCYDVKALDERKKNKSKNSAIGMAQEIGIEILNEEEYSFLQKKGSFDTKTSSWLKTPDAIREMGGAIFGDFRYGQIFIYHNGAESYYAGRGFRGSLRV